MLEAWFIWTHMAVRGSGTIFSRDSALVSPPSPTKFTTILRSTLSLDNIVPDPRELFLSNLELQLAAGGNSDGRCNTLSLLKSETVGLQIYEQTAFKPTSCIRRSKKLMSQNNSSTAAAHTTECRPLLQSLSQKGSTIRYVLCPLLWGMHSREPVH